MVDREGLDLLKQQMRDTEGYKMWLAEMREQYLKLVRTMTRGSCTTMEDLTKLRNSIACIQDAVIMTGMSKEDVLKWMEVR